MEKEGFKLVKKFDECAPCKNNDWTVWIGGPYLYENEKFLPRYYHVDHAILVIGNNADVQNFVYGVMLDSSFNPKKAVLINGNNGLSQYSAGFLKKFDAVVIVELDDKDAEK